MNESWKADLEEWLAPFVSALGHKVRERLCPLYVAGLIGPGDRKSIQPMAAREGAGGYDQLHHFVAAGTWDQAPLEDVLLQEADRMWAVRAPLRTEPMKARFACSIRCRRSAICVVAKGHGHSKGRCHSVQVQRMRP